MLQKLKIKNIALIDNVEIDFSKGLNVLSGETGAGKSVIIESLNFVLGAKADRTLIRAGQEECVVSAEFFVAEKSGIADVFNELDMPCDDYLIITRKFNIDGRSSIKINGETATVSMIKKFTSALVDVHGQSEHFELMSLTNQLKLLDKIGGESLKHAKNDVFTAYNRLKDITSQIDVLGGDEHHRAIRLDVLNYQINEITTFDLKENEEEQLTELRQKFLNQEKITNGLNCLKSAFSDEGGVEDIFSNVMRAFMPISTVSEEYVKMYEKLNDVYAEIEDLSATAQDYIDGMDLSDIDPDYVESRLDGLKKLKKKYGNDFSEIQQFLLNCEEEKEKLENFNETYAKLIIEQENAKKVLYDKYVTLSNIRKTVAKDFEQRIIQELQVLGMKSASFEIEFENSPEFDECRFDSGNGFDKITYMFSANLGQPKKLMSEVISGGEMSRFMLAIKAQSAKYNDVSTFIFDEIDAGISGNVARVVAEKFVDLSKDVQVIAITHLPQISSMADTNLLIVKEEFGDVATTTVKTLSEEDKVFEIVRLSGGEIDNKKSIEHAKEIIKLSKQYKNKD